MLESELGPATFLWRNQDDVTGSNRLMRFWDRMLGRPPAMAKSLKRNVQVIQRPVSPDPWSLENAPVQLLVPARKVRNWKLVKRKTVESFIDGRVQKIKGNFTLTPPLPDPVSLPQRLGKTLQTIRLVPYGCTNLRLSVFPRCK